ncbi:MAG: chemotaxis protein [Bradyrhizobium sp.]|nr:MAG: chemotaxis protein [Bradyrhizobium sp.]
MAFSGVIRSIAAMRAQNPFKATARPLQLHDFASDLIHDLAIALFVLDRENRVVTWNEACARLTGLEAAKVIGTKDHWKGFYLAARPCLADLALEGGVAKISELYAKQAGENAADGRLHAENWCDLPRGARVYLAIDAILLRDASGAVIGVQETLQDMTAIKQAETTIAEERTHAAERLETVRKTLGASLAQLASGNLAARVATPLPEDADQLRRDFNSAADALQSAMSAVVKAAYGIRSGADEISAAVDELSNRSQAQATLLEQTATAVDEIAGTVKKTANAVDVAHKVVSGAKADAERSGAIVGEAIEAVRRIEKSSQEIAKIIGVIDEIAFQTSLLALNAGVEAARAGDAGRGFAVVASEVRALAQRSAEAAKEIKGLISSSASQVNLGVDLVGQTGDALERIVAQISQIDAVVSKVATSSQEQASGLKMVDAAVAHMDEATRRNGEMALNTAEAARALAEETEELGRLTSRFRFDSDRGGAGDAPRPRAAQRR